MPKEKEKSKKNQKENKNVDYNELFSDGNLYKQARENKKEVIIKMNDGEEIKGYILSEKPFTLTISDGNLIRLIYKHAVKEVLFKP